MLFNKNYHKVFSVIVILIILSSFSFATSDKRTKDEKLNIAPTPKYVTYCDEADDGLHHCYQLGQCRLEDSNRNLLQMGYLNKCMHSRYCGGILYTEGNYATGQVVRTYATAKYMAGHDPRVGGATFWLKSEYTLADLPSTNSRYVFGYKKDGNDW